MLIISGVIEVNPDNVAAAQTAATAMMEETHREEGCIVYEFSQVIGAPNRFRVYEEWRDGPCLKAHSESAHMQVFRAALEEVGVVSRDVFLIKGGEKKPL
ncbi:antibiotic biosynthesis monooxygenase [Seohaeicola saemankumensis]|nr:putative quinol monooxygenase [Seohaeicola saemankumensis]MCA0871309.1 antibiotic biosynthesis monooxygenase [Seohaeicola saemankumensis]